MYCLSLPKRKFDNSLEIKNLAVLPEFQSKGYGRKLIEYVCKTYKNEFSEILVGTGDSPLTVPFYAISNYMTVCQYKNKT